MPKVGGNQRPKTPETPKALKPYLFHGVDLHWAEGDKEAKGTCPFCSREHFTVDIKTGKAQCWACPVMATETEGGGVNIYSFLRLLWRLSDEQTQVTDYKPLAINRRLQLDTLMRWGLAKSISTGDWLIPGYSVEGKITQLYRYRLSNKPLATSGLVHGLYGLPPFTDSALAVYLCEGPWDAMALWEMLGQSKQPKEGLLPTGNVERSLLADANVYGVPGANVFRREWLPLFANKSVHLLYDSDHPTKHAKTGQVIPPAGLTAVQRVSRLLMGAERPPSDISYVCWGKEGYNPDLPSGYDVRDKLC